MAKITGARRINVVYPSQRRYNVTPFSKVTVLRRSGGSISKTRQTSRHNITKQLNYPINEAETLAAKLFTAGSISETLKQYYDAHNSSQLASTSDPLPSNNNPTPVMPNVPPQTTILDSPLTDNQHPQGPIPSSRPNHPPQDIQKPESPYLLDVARWGLVIPGSQHPGVLASLHKGPGPVREPAIPYQPLHNIRPDNIHFTMRQLERCIFVVDSFYEWLDPVTSAKEPPQESQGLSYTSYISSGNIIPKAIKSESIDGARTKQPYVLYSAVLLCQYCGLRQECPNTQQSNVWNYCTCHISSSTATTTVTSSNMGDNNNTTTPQPTYSAEVLHHDMIYIAGLMYPARLPPPSDEVSTQSTNDNTATTSSTLEDAFPVQNTAGMVTLDANPQLHWIHDRMPLILSPSQIDDWLNPSISVTELIQKYTQPYVIDKSHLVDPLSQYNNRSRAESAYVKELKQRHQHNNKQQQQQVNSILQQSRHSGTNSGWSGQFQPGLSSTSSSNIPRTRLQQHIMNQNSNTATNNLNYTMQQQQQQPRQSTITLRVLDPSLIPMKWYPVAPLLGTYDQSSRKLHDSEDNLMPLLTYKERAKAQGLGRYFPTIPSSTTQGPPQSSSSSSLSIQSLRVVSPSDASPALSIRDQSSTSSSSRQKRQRHATVTVEASTSALASPCLSTDSLANSTCSTISRRHHHHHHHRSSHGNTPGDQSVSSLLPRSSSRHDHNDISTTVGGIASSVIAEGSNPPSVAQQDLTLQQIADAQDLVSTMQSDRSSTTSGKSYIPHGNTLSVVGSFTGVPFLMNPDFLEPGFKHHLALQHIAAGTVQSPGHGMGGGIQSFLSAHQDHTLSPSSHHHHRHHHGHIMDMNSSMDHHHHLDHNPYDIDDNTNHLDTISVSISTAGQIGDRNRTNGGSGGGGGSSISTSGIGPNKRKRSMLNRGFGSTSNYLHSHHIPPPRITRQRQIHDDIVTVDENMSVLSESDMPVHSMIVDIAENGNNDTIIYQDQDNTRQNGVSSNSTLDLYGRDDQYYYNNQRNSRIKQQQTQIHHNDNNRSDNRGSSTNTSIGDGDSIGSGSAGTNNLGNARGMNTNNNNIINSNINNNNGSNIRHSNHHHRHSALDINMLLHKDIHNPHSLPQTISNTAIMNNTDGNIDNIQSSSSLLLPSTHLLSSASALMSPPLPSQAQTSSARNINDISSHNDHTTSSSIHIHPLTSCTSITSTIRRSKRQKRDWPPSSSHHPRQLACHHPHRSRDHHVDIGSMSASVCGEGDQTPIDLGTLPAAAISIDPQHYSGSSAQSISASMGYGIDMSGTNANSNNNNNHPLNNQAAGSPSVSSTSYMPPSSSIHTTVPGIPSTMMITEHSIPPPSGHNQRSLGRKSLDMLDATTSTTATTKGSYLNNNNVPPGR